VTFMVPTHQKLVRLTKHKAQKISVIMPAHNEADHIAEAITETACELRDTDCEIIVVDDGSLDGTREEAATAASGNTNVKIVGYTENHGKGHALRYGSGYATGDYVVFLDADLDLHPRQIRTLLDVMETTNADAVIGSKRHPESQLDYPWHRRLMSNAYYLLVKLLFGLPIHDTQTGIKLFRSEVLGKVLPKLIVKRFAFDLELLVVAHKFGFKMVEAPIVLNFQRGFGRIKMKDIRDIWIDTMAIFYRRYILRYYD